MESLEFRAKRAYFQRQLFLMVLMLLVSVAIMMNVERVMHRDLRILVMVLGFLGAVTFGYGFLFALMRNKQALPLLKCEPDGLEFNPIPFVSGKVPWGEIKSYELVKVGLGEKLRITLRRPDHWVAQQKGFSGIVLRRYLRRFGSPVVINSKIFEDDPLEVIQAVSNWGKRNG
jgi:hypothetical protein